MARCVWRGSRCPKNGYTARGLCYEHDALVADMGLSSDYPRPHESPLVCVCEDERCDLEVDFGQCPTCGKKPLRLFLVSATGERLEPQPGWLRGVGVVWFQTTA